MRGHFILLCWLLWKERNNRTFNCRVRTVNDFLSCVADEVVSWYQAGYKHLVLVVGALGRLTGRACLYFFFSILMQNVPENGREKK